MRRVVSLLSAAFLGATLLVLAPASPAGAQGVCAGALGTASLGNPLFYPVLVSGTVSATVTAPVTTSFAVGFTVGTCVNVPGVVKPLTATGTLSGWCGHSTGSGSTSSGETFAYVSAGTFLVLTGGLTGVVSAVPDAVNGESCLTGADNFLVSGVAVKLACTVGNLTTTNVTIPSRHELAVTAHVTVVGGTHTIHTHVCV